jgi:hypothetical protein
MRDYKIKMLQDVGDATSPNVTAWIEEALSDSGGRLAPDPGPGPISLALRLDEKKVLELANKKRERIAVILRRVIASHVDLPPAEERREKSAGAMAAEFLPEKILPAKLAYTPEDMLVLVEGMDSGLVLAYRKVYGLDELEPAQTFKEDRELAAAMAESANRRSPKWLLENADLAKLTFTMVRWTMAQTKQLEKNAKETKKRPRQFEVLKPREQTAAAGDAPAASEPSNETDSLLTDEPVQTEGQFS